MSDTVRYVDLNGKGKVLRKEPELSKGAEAMHANQTDDDGENIFLYGPEGMGWIELTPRQAKRLAKFIQEVYQKA